MVGGVGNVGNASEEVRSKVRAITELLERSERRSTLDINVGGVEFSGSDVLQRSLKGLGFNLCVVPCFNGLVVPDFGCRNKCRRRSWK